MEDERLKITLYPDKEFKAKVEELARADDRSVSKFLLRALKEFFNIKDTKVKKIRK